MIDPIDAAYVNEGVELEVAMKKAREQGSFSSKSPVSVKRKLVFSFSQNLCIRV